VQYSKKNLSCLVSTFTRDIILLPASCVDWLVNQSDSVVDNHVLIVDQLQADYTFGDPAIARNP